MRRFADKFSGDLHQASGVPNARSVWTAHLFPIGVLTAVVALCSPAYAQDPLEDDDIAGRASWIGLDGVDQTHDFHDDGDEDWARFYVDIDDNPTVTIQTINPGAAQDEFDTFIEIYKDDGTTKLAENDDVGAGDLSSFLILNRTDADPMFSNRVLDETGFYLVRVFYAPLGKGNGFGPDTEYDLRVGTESAPCLSPTVLGGVVFSAVTMLPLDGVTCTLTQFGEAKTFTDVNGAFAYAGIVGGESEESAVSYKIEFSLPDFATHVIFADVVDCEVTLVTPDLNGGNLGSVFVNFGTDVAESGSQPEPYSTLSQALAAADDSATINLEPGSSSETFTGGGEISTPLTLLNNNPGGGPVRLGVVARSAASGEAPAAEVKTGFVSGHRKQSR